MAACSTTQGKTGGEVRPSSSNCSAPNEYFEKIIARHAFVRAGQVGVEAVKPEIPVCSSRRQFSHEYVTPMAESLFKHAWGAMQVTQPESVYAFRRSPDFLGR